MNAIELLGYVASASLLATFCMSTMLPLRIVAVCSSVLLAAFGVLAHIYPIAVVSLVLLLVNVVRLVQIRRLIDKASRQLESSEMSIESLLPFMTRRAVKAGHVLIRKGDDADRMYYLASGTMQIPEIDKTMEPGAVLGEIGVFARDRKRTATVVCVSDCEVYEMSESKAKELYFQDRSFGLAALQLIIVRLVEDLKRLQPASGGGNGRDISGTGAYSGSVARPADVRDEPSAVH